MAEEDGMRQKQQLNLLFLFTDQQRADTLGTYGNQVVETPSLDGLAAEGIRFDQCYTPTAICTPARASLLTGVYPFRHKLVANYERNVACPEELPAGVMPFSRVLSQAGYQVGLVSKWHIDKEHGPEAYGFDGLHYPGWGNPVQHPDYTAYLEQHNYPPFHLKSEIRGTFPNGTPGNLLAGVLEQPVEATFEYYLAERTIARLRQYAADYRARHTPFFLTCHWFGPHLPYLVPAEYYHRYDPARVVLPRSMAETFANKPQVQRNYAAHWALDTLSPAQWSELIAAYWSYVTLIDEQVGRILRAVRELGLWDETAVLYSSDHGSFTGAHRLEDKGPAMYDDIYHIPFICRIPGMPIQRSESHFTSLLDVTPTILDLAGCPIPREYDGLSLVPLIRGDSDLSWRQEITAEFHGHHFPYAQRMIRTERYKLVVNPADCNELYDLASDPDELLNRYEHVELAPVRRELMARLYHLLRTRGDNFHHWMSTMYETGCETYDTSLSQVDHGRPAAAPSATSPPGAQ